MLVSLTEEQLPGVVLEEYCLTFGIGAEEQLLGIVMEQLLGIHWEPHRSVV